MVLEQFQDCCPLMKVQAIKLTDQLSRRQQCRELPNLATYLNDPEPSVSAAACNAIRQLFANFDSESLINYPHDVLRGTVADLLEASASSRQSWLETVTTGEHVDWEYILQDGIDLDQDNITINTSTMLLLHFKKKLPDDRWAQIEASLSQELRDEFELIWNSVLQAFEEAIYNN